MNLDSLKKTSLSLIDPVTLLLILGIAGFYQYYGQRFLFFIALGLVVVGLWAVTVRRWDIAIPLETFFLGTWAYNFFEGRAYSLLSVMVIFLVLLAYAFWKLFGQPAKKSLTTLHGVYLTLAVLVVWELAVIIKLFWPVEPWSRTFVVVAALIFLELAIQVRLTRPNQLNGLFGPLIIILFLIGLVIFSTPIPFS